MSYIQDIIFVRFIYGGLLFFSHFWVGLFKLRVLMIHAVLFLLFLPFQKINMKKILCAVIFFLVSTSVSAQLFYGSVIAGANLTQVDGDELAGYKKIGANVGASVMIPLNKKQSWFTTVELLYTQKGSRQRNFAPEMSEPNKDFINESFKRDMKIKYKLDLDYVEIPVVFHFEDLSTGWAFGAGLSWARLVSVKEMENGYRLITDLNSETYSKNDWCALADVKVRLYKGLKLNFRFQYSFVPLRVRVFDAKNGEIWERKQHNNMLTLRLIYSFNEKYKLNERKNRKGERMGTKWVRDIKD